MLGTSDSWWMSCLAHRPREPAYYYIEDCWILKYTLIKFITCNFDTIQRSHKNQQINNARFFVSVLKSTHSIYCTYLFGHAQRRIL